MAAGRADSGHVRAARAGLPRPALGDVAEIRGHEAVARWYAEPHQHGQQLGRRMTADVVANPADYPRKESAPRHSHLPSTIKPVSTE